MIKRLLQFNLLVSAFIAISFTIFPDQTLSLYGITGGESLILITRYFGTTHLSFAILIGLALRSKDAQLFRFLVLSFFAGDLVGTVVLLIGQLGGFMNAAGWGLVGLSCFFALGYGFAALKKSPDSR
jgi:hypothetical protein